jgi:hypothetical protein
MSGTPKQYDVTTPEARKSALLEVAASALVWSILPGAWIVTQLLKNPFSDAELYSADSTARETESQRRTAVEIIKAGAKYGVDELEIIISEQAGVGLASSVEGFPLEFSAGTQGNMTVKVKYK